ncbi:hypothetical protein NHP21005_04190 [Helicobacter sp. NHP21005]|nr:hypothetical protein NHP21005_04190 [Helicobacter sp. NHP21005]GMB94997.1 hypothetical protein NHP21011_10920 [Helicobacter heilmannii]GMB94999.1 hypothetical protein NHP21011_10940 [Helicobacter heilmannii]
MLLGPPLLELELELLELLLGLLLLGLLELGLLELGLLLLELLELPKLGSYFAALFIAVCMPWAVLRKPAMLLAAVV